MTSVAEAAHQVKLAAIDLTHVENYADLIATVGDRRLVLLGEASHGTHEFYEARAEITKRLILEKGFGAAAVEADWPDAYRVNRYEEVRRQTGPVSRYAAIRIPVLLLAGAKSPRSGNGSVDALHRGIATSALTALKGLDHFAPEERPDTVAAHLTRFFRNSSSADGD
jgi:pimeloyl-ACP methyl ester carboxylesterase